MKKLFLTISSLIFLLIPFVLNAQTTEELLQNRYWNYRERFRQYFVSIGWKPGEGIPFSDIKLKPTNWVFSCTHLMIATNLNTIFPTINFSKFCNSLEFNLLI